MAKPRAQVRMRAVLALRCLLARIASAAVVAGAARADCQCESCAVTVLTHNPSPPPCGAATSVAKAVARASAEVRRQPPGGDGALVMVVVCVSVLFWGGWVVMLLPHCWNTETTTYKHSSQWS